MQRKLALRQEQQNVAKFQENIAGWKERASAAFDTLNAVKEKLNRTNDLAIQAGGLRSPEELQDYGNQVKQLIEGAVQLLNAKQRGQFLFAGTKSDAPPFAISTDAEGVVTGVAYRGNSNVNVAEIESGALVAVDVPGANASGSGPRGLAADSRAGADLFGHLIALQNHLLAGDVAAVKAEDLPALARDEANLIFHIGNNGGVQTRLETAGSLASAQALSLSQIVSQEADADLADSIMQLNQTQTAYQAALASGAGLLKMSLMDYLH